MPRRIAVDADRIRQANTAVEYRHGLSIRRRAVSLGDFGWRCWLISALAALIDADARPVALFSGWLLPIHYCWLAARLQTDGDALLLAAARRFSPGVSARH